MPDEDIEKQLIDMGILPETGLTTESKKQALMSLLESGDVDTANMLSSIPCKSEDVLASIVDEISVGQVWRSASGSIFEIVGRAGRGGWRVQVNRKRGRAVANRDDWLFTDGKLRGLIEEHGLKLR